MPYSLSRDFFVSSVSLFEINYISVTALTGPASVWSSLFARFGVFLHKTSPGPVFLNRVTWEGTITMRSYSVNRRPSFRSASRLSVRPFHTITILFVVTALGLGLSLEGPMRFFMLGLLSIGYSIIFFLGVIRLKLGFFVNAICRGNRTVKLVTLTFDDGPDPEATPALLEVLKHHGIKAAFFPIGKRIKDYPEIIKQIDQDGHIIGNHSFRHAWWTNFLISKALTREIKTAQETIGTVIGKIPAYFRPPMGLTNPHLRRALKGTGTVGDRLGHQAFRHRDR